MCTVMQWKEYAQACAKIFEHWVTCHFGWRLPNKILSFQVASNPGTFRFVVNNTVHTNVLLKLSGCTATSRLHRLPIYMHICNVFCNYPIGVMHTANYWWLCTSQKASRKRLVSLQSDSYQLAFQITHWKGCELASATLASTIQSRVWAKTQLEGDNSKVMAGNLYWLSTARASLLNLGIIHISTLET